jgi:hypothetical protein
VCGSFRISSGDEYLNYAIRNRKEWEQRGAEYVYNACCSLLHTISFKNAVSHYTRRRVVADMMEAANKKTGGRPTVPPTPIEDPKQNTGTAGTA